MGFPEDSARTALRSTRNNVDAAVDMLYKEQPDGGSAPNNEPSGGPAADGKEDTSPVDEDQAGDQVGDEETLSDGELGELMEQLEFLGAVS